MNMKTESGFSLIELMIVLAIVSILLGIALPAYQGYVLKSHRSDAHDSLLETAARLESYSAKTGKYDLALGTITSDQGYYTLEVDKCTGGSLDTCYQITATATAKQEKDTDCLTIGYSSAGVKSGTTDGECW
jgi:type IV pilus assembly protein PilE